MHSVSWTIILMTQIFLSRSYIKGPRYQLYSDAKAYCASVGAAVASIHSQSDQDAILSMCQAETAYYPLPSQDEYNALRTCWIGLERIQSVPLSETSWLWADGTPLDYTNWLTGEPDDDPLESYCVWQPARVYDVWISIGCEATYRGPLTICNDPTPEPTPFPTIPSQPPTEHPTAFPTAASTNPSSNPSTSPTKSSTDPSRSPSTDPSRQPSQSPSRSPSIDPTESPSQDPTQFPSLYPTRSPTRSPTGITLYPTHVPSTAPSIPPTIGSLAPSPQPTPSPSKAPSLQPTSSPSKAPLHFQPTVAPFSDLYLAIRYKDKSWAAWYSFKFQQTSDYTDIMQNALDAAFKLIYGPSIMYSVDDSWEDLAKEWSRAGIINVDFCRFSDVILNDNCASDDDGANDEEEYVAIAVFDAVANAGLVEYVQYLKEAVRDDAFLAAFGEQMNDLLDESTRRRRNLLANNFEVLSIEISDSVNDIFSNTDSDSKDDSSDGENAFIKGNGSMTTVSYVIIVAVILVIVLLIVGCVCYCKRRSEKRGKPVFSDDIEIISSPSDDDKPDASGALFGGGESKKKGDKQGL